MDIEQNKGSYQILTKLSGSKVKDVEDKPTQQVEQDPEWLVELQDNWLSIHNDFLFTRLGG